MKYGMNLLLWTSAVYPVHFPLLHNLKEWGFDGVELPMFDLDVNQYAKICAEGKMVLQSTAVTVCSPEHNPISPDATIRAAAPLCLKLAIDCCAAAGSNHIPAVHSLNAW